MRVMFVKRRVCRVVWGWWRRRFGGGSRRVCPPEQVYGTLALSLPYASDHCGTDCPDMPMSENPSGSAQSRTRRREGRPRPTLPMTGRSLGLGESTTGHGASGANGSLNADSRVVVHVFSSVHPWLSAGRGIPWKTMSRATLTAGIHPAEV